MGSTRSFECNKQLNIAERLGLPCEIIDSARELYGSASAEINEVILDMELYKQEYQRLLNESRHYIRTLQQFRASGAQYSQSKVATQLQTKVETTKEGDNGTRSSSVVERRPISEAAAQKEFKKLPEIGSSVFVSSLGKKATVLNVEQSKKEILVKVGMMKMKVKQIDIVA